MRAIIEVKVTKDQKIAGLWRKDQFHHNSSPRYTRLVCLYVDRIFMLIGRGGYKDWRDIGACQAEPGFELITNNGAS